MSALPVSEGPEALAYAVLSAPRTPHAFEGCVERLATAIRLGVYPPGQVLPPERELAATMGVSRATLREAIAALRSAGMVRTVRGRGGGTVVAYEPPVPGARSAAPQASRHGELMDSLVYRRVIEPGACAVAAERELSADQRTQLVDALQEVSVAEEPAAHRQADSRLHLTLASVTGSAQLLAAVTSVQADLHEMLLAIPVLEVNIEHSSRQHTAIVEAVLAGAAGRARRTMEQHCDDTAALLRGLIG